MGTRSVVGYYDQDDNFHGTYIHYDGYPENMMPEISKRLENGFNNYKAWVDNGIKGKGYRTIKDETPLSPNSITKNSKLWNRELMDEEFGYVFNQNGELECYDSVEQKLLQTKSIIIPKKDKIINNQFSRVNNLSRKSTSNCNIKHRNAMTAAKCPVHGKK